jgi:predicted N-acetyltransferase YhbS
MTLTNLRIRLARQDDQAAIKDVTLAAYSEYAAQIPAHWEAYRENILSTLAKYEPAEQFVAEQGNEILGSVLLYPAEGESMPEVRLLAVQPDARGQGIGAALMQACIRRASQSGAGALTLHTSDLMRSAMRLYERLGFTRAPELDFDPAPGLTIKGYRLILSKATQ